MTADAGQPDPDTQQDPDTQTLTDTGTDIYEAIATLEYSGRAPTRSAIAAATRLDEATLDRALADMTRSGLLAIVDEGAGGDGAERTYVPARRGWSTQPGQAAGHPLPGPA